MRAILLAAFPLALAPPALAHHGWGSYDSQNVMKFQATVLDVKYENPHVEIVVEHQGKRWTATLAPIFRMRNRGLPVEALVKGKPITVEGYPSRVHENELRAERVTVDGKTVELR
jgi:hypothetical protein